MGLVSRSRARLPLRRSAPARSYFVCGTPRSGTTLLAGLLSSSGLVGRAGEWFLPEAEPGWAGADYARYVAETVARTSRCGVFGAKLIHSYFADFLEKLRSVPPWRGPSDLALLENAFPRPSFVWLSRRDVVAQAVSWSIAGQTREFYAGDDRRTGAAPHYDHAVIRRLVRELNDGNESWRRWFATNGIEPLSVTYEDVCADTLAASRRVLAFLGLEVPSHVRVSELTVKQADAVNAEWVARYRREHV